MKSPEDQSSDVRSSASVDRAKAMLLSSEPSDLNESLAMILFFMEKQSIEAVSGAVVEFGSYGERTAGSLNQYLSEAEILYLVDDRPTARPGDLGPVPANMIPVVSDALQFDRRCRDYNQLRGAVRFFKSYAATGYEETWSILDLAHDLLASNGFLVLSRFQSHHFPQVAAAVHGFLRAFPNAFKILLIGADQAVLCRPGLYSSSIDDLLETFGEFMENLGYPVQLSKTQHSDFYGPLSFALRQTLAPPAYGETLYGEHLKKKDGSHTNQQAASNQEEKTRGHMHHFSKMLSQNPFALTTRIDFELSNRCNLASFHTNCPVNPAYEDEKKASDEAFQYKDYLCQGKVLSPEAYQGALADLSSHDFAGVISFHRYNDPLVYLDQVRDAVQSARLACPKADIHIYTNALQLREDTFYRLLEDGATQFTVSAYNQVSLARVQDLKTSFEGRFPEQARVVKFEILKFLAREEEDPWGNSALDDRMTLYDRARKGIFRSSPYGICKGPHNVITISHTGDMVACCLDWKDSLAFGNIREQSLASILQSPKAVRFYAELHQGIRTASICKACGWSR